MENASKALIIAGAILISILLISIGIIVMNSINEPIGEATTQSESQAVEMFNSKFTGYAGDQKGSAVKQLITSINSSNGVNDTHTITCAKTIGSIDSRADYNVDFGYDADGYINEVTITP